MANALHDLVIDEVSLCDSPANKGARALIHKRDPGAEKPGGTMDETEKIGAVAKILKVLGITRADLEKAEGEPPMPEQPVEKNIAEAVAKATAEKDAKIATLEKAAADSVAAVQKAEKDAEAAKSEVTKISDRLALIEKAEAIAKTRADLAKAGVIVDLDKMTEIVVKLRSVDATAADTLVKELQTAAEKANTAALFGEIGKSRGAATDADSAIDAATAEYRKAHPGTTEAVAMTAVLKADPSLYTRHLAEKG